MPLALPRRTLTCAATLLLVLAGASATPASARADVGPPVVLVATVAAGTSVSAVADGADRGAADVQQVLDPLRRVAVEVPAADVVTGAQRLDALPGVTSVTVAARRVVAGVPDDAALARQRRYLDAVSAPTAWGVTHGSPDVLIGVVDTGIDVGHPDLAGKIAGTFNAATGGPYVTDEVGHGTFVAGVAAAATNNGVGVAGAGYDTRLLVAKVDRKSTSGGAEDITTADEAAGIVWAVDHGARVVNISLGGEGADATERAAVEYAQRKGVLVVAAAGNEGATDPSYPAAYPGVLGVGATDAAGHRAVFSNHGPWVDLAAPGTGIYSTVPRSGSQYWRSGSYDVGDGTSFSAPLVAGAAALVAARYPTASAGTISAALTSSAHGYAGLGLGTGQVDFAAALLPTRLTGTSGGGTVIFPVRDGYRDVFAPTVVLGKRATLTLVVSDRQGRVVRTLSTSRPAGRVGITWPGTDARGRMVPAGMYRFHFEAVDALGQRTHGPGASVAVSGKRLVTVSRTLTRPGTRPDRTVRDAACARRVVQRGGSRLVNDCTGRRTRTVLTGYRFALPAAASYLSLSATVRGRVPDGRARITGALSRTRGGSHLLGVRTVDRRRARSYALGGASAGGLVTVGRQARVLVGLTNRYAGTDDPSTFDVVSVSLRVQYRVLR